MNKDEQTKRPLTRNKENRKYSNTISTKLKTHEQKKNMTLNKTYIYAK